MRKETYIRLIETELISLSVAIAYEHNLSIKKLIGVTGDQIVILKKLLEYRDKCVLTNLVGSLLFVAPASGSRKRDCVLAYAELIEKLA